MMTMDNSGNGSKGGKDRKGGKGVKSGAEKKIATAFRRQTTEDLQCIGVSEGDISKLLSDERRARTSQMRRGKRVFYVEDMENFISNHSELVRAFVDDAYAPECDSVERFVDSIENPVLADIVLRLDDVSREILYRRFALCETYAEISAKLGVRSDLRCRRILDAMRAEMEARREDGK